MTSVVPSHAVKAMHTLNTAQPKAIQGINLGPARAIKGQLPPGQCLLGTGRPWHRLHL